MTTTLDIQCDSRTASEPQVRSSELVVPQADQKCAVQMCGCTATCELAVEGEWLPICEAHALNRLLPRRPLRHNEKLTDCPPNT